jgi:hypothetical protein
VRKAEFAITPDGGRFFGLFTFEGQSAERAGALGVRNSWDQALALRGVAGSKVFVCDNLALSGEEFVFQRKNTTGLRVVDLVKDGFGKFVPALEKFDHRVEALSKQPVTVAGAEAAIYRAFVKHEVAALRLLPKVHEAYFEKGSVKGGKGEYPEVQETVWGLHNAFTRVFRELPPTPQFQATRRLGEVFQL